MTKYTMHYLGWTLIFFVLGSVAVVAPYYWFFGNYAASFLSIMIVTIMSMAVGIITIFGRLPKEAAYGSWVGMLIAFILLSGFIAETTRVAMFKDKVACAENTLGRKPLIAVDFPVTSLDKMRSWASANKLLMIDVSNSDCNKNRVAEFLISANAVGFDSRFVRENGIVRKKNIDDLLAFTFAKAESVTDIGHPLNGTLTIDSEGVGP